MKFCEIGWACGITPATELSLMSGIRVLRSGWRGANHRARGGRAPLSN